MGEAAEIIEVEEEEIILPLISELLGLITPEALDKLAFTTTAGARLPLTEIIETQHNLGNVIPISKSSDQVGDTFSVGAVCELSVGESCNLEDRPVEESSEERDIENESTSVFILAEKDRLVESDRKLKKSKIIQLYKSSSTYISKAKSDDKKVEEDEDDDINKGVLINKRHY